MLTSFVQLVSPIDAPRPSSQPLRLRLGVDRAPPSGAPCGRDQNYWAILNVRMMSRNIQSEQRVKASIRVNQSHHLMVVLHQTTIPLLPALARCPDLVAVTYGIRLQQYGLAVRA